MAHASFSFNPVSCGYNFSFFLTEDSVLCCGYNSSAALGLRAELIDTNSIPTKLVGLKNITAVSCGQAHTCFLDSEGAVWGCGWNQFGQLGFVSEDDVYEPVLIPGLPKIRAIHTSYNHSMFLDWEGDVWICGWNRFGQLGSGPKAPNNQDVDGHFEIEKVPQLPKIQAINAGTRSSYFIDVEGGVWIAGTLQPDDFTFKNKFPRKIENLPPIKLVSNTDRHTLLLDYNGSAWAMGLGTYGQLGLLVNDLPEPKQIPSLEKFTSVSTGDTHSLFLTENGEVYGCGDNADERLGIADLKFTYNLTLIPNLPTISIIYAAHCTSLYVDTNGRCWASGKNEFGELGASKEKHVRVIEELPLLIATQMVRQSTKSARKTFTAKPQN